MFDPVSSRHQGDLGGRFLPFSDCRSVGITIEVPPEQAHRPAVQHAAWMLVNLLARFDGVVHRIGLICPAHVPLAGRVVPLADRTLDLRSALLAGAETIGVVPVVPDVRLDRTIAVGGSVAIAADLYIEGSGWSGGVSSLAISATTDSESPSSLPFGPYVAACLAASEVFKAARLHPENYVFPGSVHYSLWNVGVGDCTIGEGPREVDAQLDAAIVGIGAVGSACIHALWATPGLTGNVVLCDNDPKGVDPTNLNRYVLFGRPSIGRPKASEAVTVARDAVLQWTPVDGDLSKIASLPPRVISAVDRNTSRAALQNRYPARILSASTLDLRAEILRCGPPGIGACLRCFNPPETTVPDDNLRAQLRDAGEREVADLAAQAGISVSDVRGWASTGKCGLAGDRLLEILRREQDEPVFAVSFVSVLAGTMVAAELLKDVLGAPILSNGTPRSVFQFHTPLARTNRAARYDRDPGCPMCEPGAAAGRTWAKRFAALAPHRP